MILSLLAVLNGAAQQAFVVFEGAMSSHFVDDHPGSDYSWKVLIDFSPDIYANSSDYSFTTVNGSHEISMRWNTPGLYYLDVTETDITGCTNRKVLAVNVVSNNRSIAFTTNTSSDCFNELGNGFGLPLRILEDGGVPLGAAGFPVDVGFTVNGTTYSQQILYDQQVVNIDASWFVADSKQETSVLVQLNSARDKQGVTIPLVSGGDVHTRSIRAIPQLEFMYADAVVNKQSYGTYKTSIKIGRSENASYRWFIELPNGTSTDLAALSSNTAEIFWDGPVGFYTLGVSVRDGNGCTSDTILQLVEVQKNDPAPLSVYAGPDTTIGACQTYPFNEVYPTDNNLLYQWEPVNGLNDPTIPNPVFTPGETTSYVLTVTTLLGYKYRDTVTIAVSEIQANAGNDVMMEAGNTLILNGSESIGEALNYSWTTNNGQIEEGANTAFPVVGQPGTYYLVVNDIFGCSDTDSVVVSLFANAPVANDDYDTTAYKTAVTINVLANDYDPDNDLVSASLNIVDYPQNGVVEIDPFDQTIIYTPNENFTGTDIFEYQVCDVTQLCDNARVYVLVTATNFLIPQAFTPNGDNINDFFQILGIEYYPNNSIQIINRWGKKVYEARAYGIETNPRFWDGKVNVGGTNGNLPTGTYYYIIDLGNGEKPIAGSIYIDR